MIVKPICLLLCLFVCIHEARGDQDFPGQLQTNLRSYYQHETGPKILLYLNQPEYHAGDTAFFKTYLFGPSGKKLIQGKHVVNVYLIDHSEKVVYHNKTATQNGFGKSQLILPPTIKPGVYSLIAYQDELNVNRKTPAWFRIPFTVAGEKAFVVSPDSRLRVFAEGGKTTQGVVNRFIVSGLFPNDSAFLESANKQRILGFKASPSGLGKFSFTPESEQTYFIRYKNTLFPVDSAQEKGVALTLTYSADHNFTINLQASAVQHFLSQQVYLIVSHQDSITHVTPISFEESLTQSFLISYQTVPAGINRITLLTTDGSVLADRLFYKDPAPENSLTINLNKKEFGTRDLVKLDVRQNGDAAFRSINAAVTVFRKDTFASWSIKDPFQSFMALADIEASFPPSPGVTENEYNDYLITARSTVSWQDVLKNFAVKKNDQYPVYFKGQVISNDGKIIRDSTMITFWLKDQDFVYEIFTTPGGRFQFPLFTPFTDDEVLYTVTFRNSVVENVKIVLDTPTVPLRNGFSYSASSKVNPYYLFSSLRASILKSYSYNEQRTKQLTREKNEVESIPADFTFNIEKFKPFPSVVEMMNEVIPLVRAKKVRDKFELRVFMKESAMLTTANPLIMIDGVITDSITYFLDLNPSQIKTLGVINSRNKLLPYGALGRNGIIVVETNRTETPVLRNKNSVFVKGVDTPRPFQPLDFSGNLRNNIPYLRTALFWDENLSITKNKMYESEFYTSDDTGEYVINISGIDSHGLPVEFSETFAVERQLTND